MLTSVKQPINNIKVLTFDPMLEKKYKNIIYFIALTIVATIGVQIYWNIKIYEVNKQQLINQVQVSFDNAVENYYNELAKENVLTLIQNDTIIDDNSEVAIKSLRDDNHVWLRRTTDSLNPPQTRVRFLSDFLDVDTIRINEMNSSDIRHISVYKERVDSVDVQNLTTKILFSFRESEVDLEKIDSLFIVDLGRKNITIAHGFKFETKNPFTDEISTEEYHLENFPTTLNTLTANSSFLPHHSNFQLLYTDMTFAVLKRMLSSILLSLLLSAVIVGCLLFLLKIIFKQKQLSEVKNDLISNITHEFKTPIATISVALEGLQNFDAINTPEKAEKYISMSRSQVGKLNTMVEKLLETATLKTDEFDLNKEEVNLTDLLKNCVEKHQFTTSEKQLIFDAGSDIFAKIDKFHFENAINNILDNAIKYGGNIINITLNDNLEITVEDNGNGIPQNQQKKVFEQFYRIPTGNIHNIKGFGIGLYYTKSIIEKHGGTIVVSESKKGKNVFKITLKNG